MSSSGTYKRNIKEKIMTTIECKAIELVDVPRVRPRFQLESGDWKLFAGVYRLVRQLSFSNVSIDALFLKMDVFRYRHRSIAISVNFFVHNNEIVQRCFEDN